MTLRTWVRSHPTITLCLAGITIAASISAAAIANAAPPSFEAAVKHTTVSGWEPTGWTSGREVSRCAADELVVGIKIEPDEVNLGSNFVKCAEATVDGVDGATVRAIGAPTKSDWIDENQPSPDQFDCEDDALIGAIHLGSYSTGETQYRCAPLVIDAKASGHDLRATVEHSSWTDWMPSAEWIDHKVTTTFEYACPKDSVLSGREHRKNGIGEVRFRCTSWNVVAA